MQDKSERFGARCGRVLVDMCVSKQQRTLGLAYTHGMARLPTARWTRVHVARRALELDLPLVFVASLLETSASNLRRGKRLRRILDGELPLPIDESAFERWSDAELLKVVETWCMRRVRGDEPDAIKEPAAASHLAHASEHASATIAPSSLATSAAAATTPVAAAAAPAAPTVSEPVAPSAPSSLATPAPAAPAPAPAALTPAADAPAAPPTSEPIAVRVHEHAQPAHAPSTAPAPTAPTASTATCDVEPISSNNKLVSALKNLAPLATIDGIVVIGPYGLASLVRLSPSAAVAFLQQYDIAWNLDLVTLTRAVIAALSFGLLPNPRRYCTTWRDHVLEAVDTATGLPHFAVPPKVAMAWSKFDNVAVPDACEREAVEATKKQLKETIDAVLDDRTATDEASKARDLLTAVGLPDPEHLPLPPGEWGNRTAAGKTQRYIELQWQQQDDDHGTQFWWHRSHSEAVLKLLDKPFPWSR